LRKAASSRPTALRSQRPCTALRKNEDACAREARRRAPEQHAGVLRNAHYATGNAIVRLGSVVLLPKFGGAPLLRRNGPRRRVLTRAGARALQGWAHYQFRQRLFSLGRFKPGVRVVLTNEAWTTRT
jgi:hypothetical protein